MNTEAAIHDGNRNRLWREFVLVVVVALGPAILNSLAYLMDLVEIDLYRRLWYRGAGSAIMQHLLAMLLALHFMTRRAGSSKAFGLNLRPLSIPIGVASSALLFVYTWIAAFMMWVFVSAARDGPSDVFGYLAHDLPTSVFLLYLLSGSLMEELITRSYVMTRLRQFGASWTTAVICSTLLQMLYHLHHGVNLVSSVIGFATLSVLYAWRRDFWAVASAHFCYNLILTLYNY